MTHEFSYTATFTLDKAHFIECFEQSVSGKPQLKDYQKAGFMMLIGALLVIFTSVNPYASWFIFALGVIEALSVHYRRGWWVARQLLSKAANSEVTLTINDKLISAKSYYGESTFEWSDNPLVVATEKGWIIQRGELRNYISNSCLSEDAKAYVATHASDIKL
ncbi:YcxB family protein [Thalassotalea fusca]